MVQVWEVLEPETSDLAENYHECEVCKDHQSNDSFAVPCEVVCSSQDYYVRHETAHTVNQMAHSPEANVFAVGLNASSGLNKCDDAEVVDHKAMNEGVNQILCEDTDAEALAFHAQPVQQGVVHESALVVLEIIKGEPHNWQGGHRDVVQLVDKRIIKGLSRESRLKAEVVLRHYVQDILVKRVCNQECISSVSFTAMHEEKRP
jgi:hypothetical protein